MQVVGDRRVAVKRVILDGAAKDDFTLTTAQPAPFIVGIGDEFEVSVRYQPRSAPATENARIVISYTDASATESDDRLPPGEVVIPLVRRLVGEPLLVATPASLSFGAVPVGQKKTLPMRLSNDGFGNVALALTGVDGGTQAISLSVEGIAPLLPDAGVEVPVTFAPTSAAYTRTQLAITYQPDSQSPLLVTAEGTSLSSARLAADPAAIAFGELPRRQRKVKTLSLMNQGGQPLTLRALELTDASGNLSAQLAGDTQLPVTLPPLGRVSIDIALEGKTPVEVNGALAVDSDDPQVSSFSVPITGKVTEPKLSLTPALLDFRTVPVGWVVSKQVVLENTGSGGLTLKNVQLVSGSSALFTLRNVPSLPSVLDPGKRLTLEVEFRAEASATFGGALSIESDDPISSFAEVELKAVGGSCAVGCPIANGTSSCAGGVCAVGSCNAGYFDTDKKAATGCECKEIGTDPGSFCADSVNRGVLKDNDNAQTTVTGIIPTQDDVDVIRFYAQDAFSAWGDDFKVKIRLESNDPGIQMCIYRYDTGSRTTECYFTNETCPSNRSYQKGGGLGEDGAEFIVKVFRTQSSAPTCTPYTVFMSNGI